MKLGGDEYVYYDDGCDGFTCIHMLKLTLKLIKLCSLNISCLPIKLF